MILRLGQHELALGDTPLIMGIVNIGADSVADSTHLRSLDEQLAYARRQLEHGASILDIGTQSGRTDTSLMSEEQELALLLPLVHALNDDRVPFSVETWRPSVAVAAIEAGASAINDVSGLADLALADLAAETGAALVVMHTRARPKEERFPEYADLMADVIGFLDERCNAAVARGVEPDRLIIDPGLDFAKTPEQSIEVLRRLDELRALERPVLLAVSRKYFLGVLTDAAPDARLAATLAAVDHGVGHGAQILRVHDVPAVAEFLHVRATLRATSPPVLHGDPGSATLKWLEPKSV
jgi:dihydropteroate synthase